MRVLIACEESQTVTKAFRALGYEAYSCDLQECSGGRSEWHLKGDVIDYVNDGWDMMIAHPPCTYLSRAGARWLYPKGELNIKRFYEGLKGKAFFDLLLNLPIKYIAVENPLPQKVYGIKDPDQIIQPYMFGNEAQKATGLWLKNLPLLKPTKIVSKGEFVRFPGTGHRHSKWFMEKNAKDRSKTFPGIAQAMAEQWSNYIACQTHIQRPIITFNQPDLFQEAS